VPQIVLQFIEKLKNGRKDRYFFAIATYKSDPGGAIDQMSRKLNRLGIKLSAGFTIAMPGNNIIFYDPEPEQEQVRKLNELKLKAAEIAEAVSCKKEILPASSAVDRILKTGLLNSLISCTFKNSDRRFRTVSTCSRCGTCVQVCAAGNIRLVDGHPVWQHHCQQCTACINLCPKNAIQSGKSTVGRQRYKNPDVDIWDLSHRST
jgi:NAD-dependent dihydropyrimidine dehydrogenase PreA subunit